MKFRKIYSIILTILLIYSAVIFLVPIEKDQSFWLPASLTIVAIVSQFLFVYLTSISNRNLRSPLYGVHIVRLGIYYLISQFILSTLCIVLKLPDWVPLAYSIFLITATTIGAASAFISGEFIEKQNPLKDESLKQMYELRNQTNDLISICNDTGIAAQLLKWLDDLNSSDPVTNKQTLYMERSIKELLDEMQDLILKNNYNEISALIGKCHVLLVQRNRLSKNGWRRG